MEVVVLGSGSCIPHPSRRPAGMVVRTDSGDLLVDTGPGAIHTLACVGIEPFSIQEVLYTHIHPDHVLDVVSLLFAKHNPGVPNAPKLTLRGGPGLDELISSLRELFHPWLEPRGYELRVELYGGPVEIGKVSLRATSLSHHPSSLAWRIEDDRGKSVVISGDTAEDAALIELSRGVDLLVLECSFPEGQEVEGHLSPSRAGRIAGRAAVRRLLLTHFYPLCDGREILAPCRRSFEGEVILAYDGMRIEVD